MPHNDKEVRSSLGDCFVLRNDKESSIEFKRLLRTLAMTEEVRSSLRDCFVPSQ
ncbi:hypothetical protein ACN4EE_05895 [Geminocystis sp. CENA526]|uniref:hypothetical protein n=1 Tax=Geminocystis sp. CENA526 TaxID=1355871 RepID=UPI003D6F3C03